MSKNKNKNRYRILATADIHSSNRLPHSKPTCDGMTDRLCDVINVIEKINMSAKNYNVDSIFILGDIFDRSLVDAVTLTQTAKALSETPVTTYIMAGNHDANSIRGGRFVVEAFGVINHDKLVYLDKKISPTNWLNFIPIPFMATIEAKNKIKSYKDEISNETVNVLLFHNSVLGCNHADWTCDDGLEPDLLTTDFDYALGGHFHAPQQFGENNNGMYLGAPLHHNFGDKDRDAGYWIIDFYEDGDADFDFIDSEAPKFHVTNELIADESWKRGDYVRVELQATNADWVKMKPGVENFIDSLEGLNVSYKHKPIYHHKKRLDVVSGETENVTIEGAIEEYVKSKGIVTGGLNKKRLKNIGIDILHEVRTENGFQS